MTNTFAALIAQLDPDKYVKGKQFEHLSKWFFQNDAVYRREFKRVWLWKEWPYKSPTGAQWRWKDQEAGIDLVAQHQDGTLTAIQAKAYKEINSVTKNDMAKFLSESSRSVFSHRLLITTADHVAPHAEDAAKGSEKGVTIVDRAYLEDAEINWPASLSDLRASQPPPKRSRRHQRKAINAVVKGFDKANRGQMIMACGTGKTLTSMWIREKLAAQRRWCWCLRWR
jgi:predicted helicase